MGTKVFSIFDFNKLTLLTKLKRMRNGQATDTTHPSIAGRRVAPECPKG